MVPTAFFLAKVATIFSFWLLAVFRVHLEGPRHTTHGAEWENFSDGRLMLVINNNTADNSRYMMKYEDFSMAKGQQSEVLSSRSSLKALHRSYSVSDEADMLAKAISQASAAAKSILMSGGNQDTASSTARAAAQSVLNPSRSAFSDFSGKNLLSRRHARQKAEVIAAMALVSARKELEDQQKNVSDGQRGNASLAHVATTNIPSSNSATASHSNTSLVRNARGVLPQMAAPLFQSDTETDAGSETGWPSPMNKSAFPTNEQRPAHPAEERDFRFGIDKLISPKRVADNEKFKEEGSSVVPKTLSRYFQRKKLRDNPSDEEKDFVRQSGPKDGSITIPKNERFTNRNTTQQQHPRSRISDGSYYDSCSYDDGSDDISYDRTSEASIVEKPRSSKNATGTAPLSEDGCLMASIAAVFSCGPSVPKSRPSLSTFTDESRDDHANFRNSKVQDDSRVDRKDEGSNDTQDILRELNASRYNGPNSKTISGRTSPLRESMEKIVMGALTTPTVVSSHKKAFQQRLSRGGRNGKEDPMEANLSNLSGDGASEISTFSRPSRMRLWTNRRKKTEQPE